MPELSNSKNSTDLSNNVDEVVIGRNRVLVVEDNAINQILVKTYLNRFGCRVEVAANGEEALALLLRGHYDLILMDVQMPVMCGLEATRRIRELGDKYSVNRLPIVAMTAGSTNGDRNCCIEAGMNDYLTKPISNDAIADILGLWLKA